MMYVQRAVDGTIIGLYANPQPGIAEELATPEELAAHAAVEQAAQHNATIFAAISAEEQRQARPLREHALAADDTARAAAAARITEIDVAIEKLRGQLIRPPE